MSQKVSRTAEYSRNLRRMYNRLYAEQRLQDLHEEELDRVLDLPSPLKERAFVDMVVRHAREESFRNDLEERAERVRSY